MIIPEGTPESPSKLRQEQFPSPGSSAQRPPSPSSPPAYPGYNAIPGPQYPYQPYPDPRFVQTPTLPLVNKPRRGHPKKRFFKTLFFAVAIYAAVALIVRIFMIIVDSTMHDIDTVIGYPQKADGRIQRCVYGGDNPWLPTSRAQQITFDLPLSADVLYVFARGSRSSGQFQLMADDSSVPQGTMRIEIQAQYGSQDSFKRTTVCEMERATGEKGVGIFTPSRRLSWGSDLGHFIVTVRLPKHSNRSAFVIPNFEVHLPQFMLTIPDLERILHFGSLSLKSTNEPIAIGSIDAARAEIITSNSEITGLIRTNSSLDIHTSNAPIAVTVIMESKGTSNNVTKVDISTSNNVLTAAVSLLTDNHEAPQSPDAYISRYNVKAETSNGPINVHFPQHQPYCHLDLIAKSSNGVATVRLQPAYEGTIDLSTSSTYRADVIYNADVEDPAGHGRKRDIQRKFSSRGRYTGYVGWGSGAPVDGSVVVKTSNAQTVLDLQ